jgi:hypothetical protein
MRSLACALVCALVCACAGYKPYVPTVPEGTKRVESTPLPPDPAKEPLPDGFAKGEWVEPLEAGSCLDKKGETTAEAVPCPARSGIAVSEERAYRDGLYRVRYKELRTTCEADRQVWGAHRELYEGRLKLADQAIQDLQPKWWDRHKFQIGTIGGIILGVAATVAILAVTEEVQE